MSWVVKYLAELGGYDIWAYYQMAHGYIGLWAGGRIVIQESTRSCIQTFLEDFNLFANAHANWGSTIYLKSFCFK